MPSSSSSSSSSDDEQQEISINVKTKISFNETFENNNGKIIDSSISLSSTLSGHIAPSLNPKFQCRFYENQYPHVDDYVMVTVKHIAEMGAYVSLLEFNGVEGMVLLSELSRKRIRSVNREIRVGKTEIVIVLRVDRDKGYIDLSKRRVTPEDAEKFEDRFQKSKTVHSILRHVAEKRDCSLEGLYEMIGWPLYKKFGHAYDAFKLALQNPEEIWTFIDKNLLETTKATIDLETKAELILGIKRRLTPQKVKIRSDIEVACFDYEGVDAVKRALIAGESPPIPNTNDHDDEDSKDTIVIRARLVAPPLYVLMCTCMDKEKGLLLMNESIERIQASIKASNGQMVIKMKPKVVSDIDDKALDLLMKKAEVDNTEVGGDEDHSEM